MVDEKKELKSEKSKKIDVNQLIVDSSLKIDLQRFIYKETEALYSIIKNWTPSVTNGTVQVIAMERIEEAECATKDLRQVFYYIAHFGTEDQVDLLRRSLNRIADVPNKEGNEFLRDLQIYPAMLLLYAAGIASLASYRYGNVKTLFDSQALVDSNGRSPLIMMAHANMIDRANANTVLGTGNLNTPLSDRLNELFKHDVPAEILFGNDFDSLFDMWEIMISLQYASIRISNESGEWVPVGRFGWRSRYSQDNPMTVIECNIMGNNTWLPVRLGLFGGSDDTARSALELVKKLSSGRHW